ncbi:MAG TPA: hypothetical protein VGK89_10065 [Candidatus Eisenbacteria bacterium]|jgi:hypothetical protein
MKHRSRWLLAILIPACLWLASCKPGTEAAAEEAGPAKVEHLKGAEPTRVTLTEEAAKRLDIQTAEVRDLGAGKAIPYAAVLYDTDGNTWTYLSPEPLVFVRHRITVDRIDGELALLSDGPAAGTLVVTVGAEELYGSELEFEEE